MISKLILNSDEKSTILQTKTISNKSVTPFQRMYVVNVRNLKLLNLLIQVGKTYI